MVRVVIYGEHKEETEGLEGMLRAILTEKQRWPVIHTYIGNLESYLHFVRGNPYLIMLVSVIGNFTQMLLASFHPGGKNWRNF